MNLARFILLSFFWGGSFLAIHKALAVFHPFQAASLRIGIAAVFLLIYALGFHRKLTFGWREAIPYIGVGVFSLGLPWSMLFYGEQYVAPAIASIINSAVPIFVIVFSVLLSRTEKADLPTYGSIGMGFIGILLVFSKPFLFPSDQALRFELRGLLAILATAASYGLGTTMVKRLGTGVPASWGFVIQAIGGLGVTLGLSAWSGEPWKMSQFAPSIALAGIIYLAVFSTAIAWLFYFTLIHQWSAVRASMVTYMIPIVAIIADGFILRKLPHLLELGGVFTILMAVSFANPSIRRFFYKWRIKKHQKVRPSFLS